MATHSIHSIEQIRKLQQSPSASAINEWLDLMEEFESPRDYLTWGFITAVSAILGKRSCLKLGPFITVRPNLFTVLIGPAGVRKSSAIGAIKKLLAPTTVRFGPSDTGGQRHGLMAALEGHAPPETDRKLNPSVIFPALFGKNKQRAPNDLFLVASELGRLFGTSSRELADFLVDLWDGEDVIYQTRSGETRSYGPVVSMLGATTPSSFATMIPENAAGHGILSRILFVHADKNYKSVPMAPAVSPGWVERYKALQDKLLMVDDLSTEFAFTKDALGIYESLYKYTPELTDPRLGAYIHRRPTMLLKVSMTLCALRETYLINETDIRLAHELLDSIEPNMYRALEYFGRNKALFGKMLMLEYLRSLDAAGAVSRHELVAIAAKDLSTREADEALESLLSSGEVITLGGNFMLGSTKNTTIRLVK